MQTLLHESFIFTSFQKSLGAASVENFCLIQHFHAIDWENEAWRTEVNLPEVAQNIAELSDQVRFWTILNLTLCQHRSSGMDSVEWNSSPESNGCNLAKEIVCTCWSSPDRHPKGSIYFLNTNKPNRHLLFPLISSIVLYNLPSHSWKYLLSLFKSFL